MKGIITALRATKGWRTLIVSVALAVTGVLQAADWTTLVPADKVGPVMAGIGVAMAVLRLVTSGPVGRK